MFRGLAFPNVEVRLSIRFAAHGRRLAGTLHHWRFQAARHRMHNKLCCRWREPLLVMVATSQMNTARSEKTTSSTWTYSSWGPSLWLANIFDIYWAACYPVDLIVGEPSDRERRDAASTIWSATVSR
jgi:hypothetical protein